MTDILLKWAENPGLITTTAMLVMVIIALFTEKAFPAAAMLRQIEINRKQAEDSNRQIAEFNHQIDKLEDAAVAARDAHLAEIIRIQERSDRDCAYYRDIAMKFATHAEVATDAAVHSTTRRRTER